MPKMGAEESKIIYHNGYKYTPTSRYHTCDRRSGPLYVRCRSGWKKLGDGYHVEGVATYYRKRIAGYDSPN